MPFEQAAGNGDLPRFSSIGGLSPGVSVVNCSPYRFNGDGDGNGCGEDDIF